MAFPLGSSQTTATLAGTLFDLFTYKPAGTINGILLVFHGTDRNAADYRDYAIPVADRFGFVVVAPLFDDLRFGSTYHRANVFPGNPPDTWTTRFVPPMVQWAKGEEGQLPVHMYGYSAGGQFMARTAAFQPDHGAVRIVAGAAATYVRPQVGAHPTGEEAPYGMGGIYATGEQAELTRYIQSAYQLHVGGADNDPSDPNLTTGVESMRQGTDRRSRAEFIYAEGQSQATARGETSGWGLRVAPRLSHQASRMLRSRTGFESLRLKSIRVVEDSAVVSHATSGTLNGQGAETAGTAARARLHDASGALTGAGAQVAGDASRSLGPTTHATSGALSGQAASVAGSAARGRVQATTGALTGQGAQASGAASRTRLHATTGAPQGSGAALQGAADHQARVAVTHSTSGALAGSGAELSGGAQNGTFVAPPGGGTGAGAGGRGFSFNRAKRLYPRVKPKKKRDRRKAVAIEIKAAEAVIAGEGETRFRALMQQWLELKPELPQEPGIDPYDLFMAQVAMRIQQQEQDDEDAILALFA